MIGELEDFQRFSANGIGILRIIRDPGVDYPGRDRINRFMEADEHVFQSLDWIAHGCCPSNCMIRCVARSTQSSAVFGVIFNIDEMLAPVFELYGKPAS
ncbi:hypothetical protein MCBMB27_05305 [Methylobacterium phyllosphaerae]|uniref:Uncharacterized protein n=1 Tax=Methylobacterium phyllosphaerae TaxID=418223 RepID=A0AAE8HVI2_9HYPH|nr:hypothetical protein MCBMB27_05305 [Methylobacterium phyllosphaerae]SFH38904.1 hypothetical protein SAMN05192567_122111 [Methylobacterium phyllosphaerae]